MEHEHQFQLILDKDINGGTGVPEEDVKRVARAILEQGPVAKRFQWAFCVSCGAFTFVPSTDGEMRIVAGRFFYKGKLISI